LRFVYLLSHTTPIDAPTPLSIQRPASLMPALASSSTATARSYIGYARAIVLLAPTHERRVKTLKERASAHREERLARRSAIAALHGAQNSAAKPEGALPSTARRFDWRRVKAAFNALIQRLPRNAQYLARLTRCD